MLKFGPYTCSTVELWLHKLSIMVTILCSRCFLFFVTVVDLRTYKVTSTLYMLAYEHEVDGGSSYILSVCVSVSVHKMV